MGQLIPFMHRQTGPRLQKPVENARILFFTGVRYERPEPRVPTPADLTPVPSPAPKRRRRG